MLSSSIHYDLGRVLFLSKSSKRSNKDVDALRGEAGSLSGGSVLSKRPEQQSSSTEASLSLSIFVFPHSGKEDKKLPVARVTQKTSIPARCSGGRGANSGCGTVFKEQEH